MSEKTAALEAEAFKTKRNFEETAILKRKVERLKKIEMATDKDMDEILKEEIREYKETLTCPSCKVKRKDAILTKCFHVFCYDCLRYVSNIYMFSIHDLNQNVFTGLATRPDRGNVQSVMQPSELQIITACIYLNFHNKFLLCCK